MPIKINHAILHVFDFVSCENTFSQEEMDLTSKNAKNFVAKHATKALGNLDNKRGVFAPDSLFAEELRAYHAGQRDFVELSCKIGDFLVTELGHMEKTPSTDLLVVDFENDASKAVNQMTQEEAEASFQGRADRYFAILLLESKQAYMHAPATAWCGSRQCCPAPAKRCSRMRWWTCVRWRCSSWTRSAS